MRPAAGHPGGYLGAKWGAAPPEVIKVFPFAKPAPGGKLFVTNPVAGHKAQTVLFFSGEKLNRVVVTFQENHDDPNRYIQEFFALRDLLVKKYGKSVEEINRWRDRHPIHQPSKWGNAVKEGQLSMFAAWKTRHTEIVLMCGGHQGRPRLVIQYTSKALSKAVEQEREKPLLRDL